MRGLSTVCLTQGSERALTFRKPIEAVGVATAVPGSAGMAEGALLCFRCLHFFLLGGAHVAPEHGLSGPQRQGTQFGLQTPRASLAPGAWTDPAPSSSNGRQMAVT